MNYYDDFYEGLNDTRSILYRQIDTVAVLNKLLATLCSELHNLQNYKINIVGENNYVYKLYLDKLIKNLRIYDNKLQELIKIKNGFPLFQLNDIENISLIKTFPSMDYKSSTISNNLNSELKTLLDLLNESINSAQKEADYLSVTLLSKLSFIINNGLIELP